MHEASREALDHLGTNIGQTNISMQMFHKGDRKLFNLSSSRKFFRLKKVSEDPMAHRHCCFLVSGACFVGVQHGVQFDQYGDRAFFGISLLLLLKSVKTAI